MSPKETSRIPLDTGWQEPPEENPIIAQIEGIGNVFRRNIAASSEMRYDIVDENNQTVTMTYEMILMGERVVRVISFLDEKTGFIGYTSLDSLPEGFHPSDFQHKSLSSLSKTDRSTVEKELINILKSGASKPFFDLDEKIREHDGDPTYRVPKSKQGGWGFTQK